jgi:hypothetical protein
VDCVIPEARYCDGDELVVFETTGRCDKGNCYYAPIRITCENGCSNAACVDESRCLGVSCNLRPASYCVDNDTLRSFPHAGTCKEGACHFISETHTCDQGCVAGRCKEAPCTGVSCYLAEPVSCIDGDLHVWDGETPECNNGYCIYNSKSIDCDNGCEQGRCIADPCEDIDCASTFSDFCDGEAVWHYLTPEDACVDGVCNLLVERETCEYGCEGTACLTSPVDIDTDTDTDTGADADADADTDTDTDIAPWDGMILCGSCDNTDKFCESAVFLELDEEDGSYAPNFCSSESEGLTCVSVKCTNSVNGADYSSHKADTSDWDEEDGYCWEFETFPKEQKAGTWECTFYHRKNATDGNCDLGDEKNLNCSPIVVP